MTTSESPAVARRRVRLALRRARERKGFTQGHVAEVLDWSLSKVNRIESGEVTVSTTDLRAMLALYGVSERARVDQLLDEAKASRRRGWWAEARYREHLTDATLQLLQLESEASTIRAFYPILVPGIFQTPDYARAVLEDPSQADLSPEDVAVRFEVRMRRREQVFGHGDPPEFYILLDESVLSREIGGPAVSGQQFNELLAIAGFPRVSVRVVPFAKAATVVQMGQFTILELGDESDAVLYRERYLQDEIVHATQKVRRHREIFEELWERSFDEQATSRLIAARAADLLSEVDRRRLSG
jgi:transcriptional regulator with XRE-family HTH domain